jgi:hypothetical protein
MSELMTPEEMIEAIGPCTDDVRDCEIMRAAWIQTAPLEDVEPYTQRFRSLLAKAACDDCRARLLPDFDSEGRAV